MLEEQFKSIPEATLRRLPLYHRHLKTLQQVGRRTVSCPEIGTELKLDPTQIRKDLEVTGITGRPKVGYQLDELVLSIERFLGWDNMRDAFLVGAGHLGAALLGYTKFEACGLSIVAAFDSDATKVGTTLRGKQVLPLSKLVELTQRMHVHIGIITVPASAAQAVADLMVEGGMRAIWNFAPVRLQVPPNMIVHNEDLYCSLASLSQKLAAALRPALTPPPTGAAAPPTAGLGVTSAVAATPAARPTHAASPEPALSPVTAATAVQPVNHPLEEGEW